MLEPILVNDIAEPIAVPLLVDDVLELAPNVDHPLFIVALGTVKFILVPPLYKVPLAVLSAVVHPFALNVAVKVFLHTKYAVAVLFALATLTLNVLPDAVPLVALLLVEPPKFVQFVFIVGVGTVTLALVAPLYIVVLADPFAVAHPFVLNVTVTDLLQI